MGTEPEPEATAEFSIDAEKLDDGTIVRVVGRTRPLDARAPRRGADDRSPAGGGAIVVDLTGCDFIDSSGIRALLIGRQAAEDNGGTLALAAAKPQVVRILDVTGVASALPIHASADEALAAQAIARTSKCAEGRWPGWGRRPPGRVEALARRTRLLLMASIVLSNIVGAVIVLVFANFVVPTPELPNQSEIRAVNLIGFTHLPRRRARWSAASGGPGG